jgi:hypothetical protein
LRSVRAFRRAPSYCKVRRDLLAMHTAAEQTPARLTFGDVTRHLAQMAGACSLTGPCAGKPT